MRDPHPRRIASLVPSLTQTLFDLGAGDRVVAVSDWCGPALPAGAEPVRVGGVRDPDLDRLLAPKPDLVLLGREENRREDAEAIAAAGARVLVVQPTDLPTAAAAVAEIGRAVGLAEAGARLASAIEQQRSGVLASRGAPVTAVYPIWNDPWMTVGPGSYSAAILADAGASLVGADGEVPYPALDLGAARRAGPCVLLLPDEPCDFHGPPGDEAIAALTPPTGPAPAAVRVDGRWAAWYGSRSGRHLERLAGLLERHRT